LHYLFPVFSISASLPQVFLFKTCSSSLRVTPILIFPLIPIISRRISSTISRPVKLPKLPSTINLSPVPSGRDIRLIWFLECSSRLNDTFDLLFFPILGLHLLPSMGIPLIINCSNEESENFLIYTKCFVSKPVKNSLWTTSVMCFLSFRAPKG